MEINAGDYVRTKDGNIYNILDDEFDIRFRFDTGINYPFYRNGKMNNQIIKHSEDIIDLIEYMDLLVIENPIKLYDKNIEVALFNPVRCDGFTTYEDGTECIILNLDYIVDVKDLKIKSILTNENFEANAYKIEKER